MNKKMHAIRVVGGVYQRTIFQDNWTFLPPNVVCASSVPRYYLLDHWKMFPILDTANNR